MKPTRRTRGAYFLGLFTGAGAVFGAGGAGVVLLGTFGRVGVFGASFLGMSLAMGFTSGWARMGTGRVGV